MKFWTKMLVFTASVCLAAGAAFGGDLEPAAPPGSMSGYTMDDLYNRLKYGTDVSPQTFTEPGPVDGPITGSVRTVDEVMMVAPARDDVNGATSKDVVEGKRFWGLTGEEWGGRAGTFVKMPANVSQTGQTKCWDEEGMVISCTGTGQDGELTKGVPLPTPRFTDNGDGTVKDNKTGLIWLKDANCFGRREWTVALSDCNDLADPDCGLSDGSKAGDWRLPNIQELRSLVHHGYSAPALSNVDGTAQWSEEDSFGFEKVQSDTYWSGTSYAIYTLYAWYINIASGYVNASSNGGNRYVWPIRGGY